MSGFSASENILFFVLGFGVLQGILLAAVTFFYPGSDKSVNIFLALYILSVSMVMMLPLALVIIPWQDSFFHQPVPLLVGPFLYFYISSFRKVITWKKALPHFIPFIIYFVPAYYNMEILAEKYPDEKLVPVEVMRDPVSILLTSIKLIQAVVYYVLCINALKRYQRTVKQMFSEIGTIRIAWAKILVYGYLLLVVVAMIFYGVMLQSPDLFQLLFLLNMVIGCPYIYIVTFKGIAQPTLWQIQKQRSKQEIVEGVRVIEELEDQVEERGVRKLNVDEVRVSEIVKKITNLMEQQKLYLKPDLTVQEMAAQLGTPAYQVSQIINETLNKSFYDLINGYRVEEARRLLLDPKAANYKVLTIGIESGFNSKTTFNTVFKKSTGMTPTEYREKNGTLASSPEQHT